MSKKLGYYFNSNQYNKNNYIIKFTNKEVQAIENADDEKVILKKLKHNYKVENFSKEKLKEQLIFIENRKIKLKKSNTTSIFTAIMSIFMSFIAAMLGIINSANSIVISAQNKAGVKAYEFLEEAKKTIQTYNGFINLIAGIVFLFFFILIMFIVKELINNNIDVNIGLLANIHKSVIEEQLKELEKEKLVNEKEDKTEKDIEYLKDKIYEYKYKTELLEDICKVNTINR